jgi:hypothetical protein
MFKGYLAGMIVVLAHRHVSACTLLLCLQLSALHVEKWQVLSHHSATYTSIRDPAHTFTTAGRANIKTGVAYPAAQSRIPGFAT